LVKGLSRLAGAEKGLMGAVGSAAIAAFESGEVAED
jgi:hypothetical protein